MLYVSIKIADPLSRQGCRLKLMRKVVKKLLFEGRILLSIGATVPPLKKPLCRHVIIRLNLPLF
ncbi:hypothetical protein AYO49_03910 [Verrucomicrobiaceae bacterium SCGC AG-212-N21]|nr:hypothetical protein AYO49_03910 [Verrucomicrobiaceae bacterium SCGC AG-212-N21]